MDLNVATYDLTSKNAFVVPVFYMNCKKMIKEIVRYLIRVFYRVWKVPNLKKVSPVSSESEPA